MLDPFTGFEFSSPPSRAGQLSAWCTSPEIRMCQCEPGTSHSIRQTAFHLVSATGGPCGGGWKCQKASLCCCGKQDVATASSCWQSTRTDSAFFGTWLPARPDRGPVSPAGSLLRPAGQPGATTCPLPALVTELS